MNHLWIYTNPAWKGILLSGRRCSILKWKKVLKRICRDHIIHTTSTLHSLGVNSGMITWTTTFLKIFTVIQLQLSAFSPHPSTPLQPNPSLSPASTLPPWFCPCVLYSSSCNPLFPLSPSPPPALVIVRLFLTSMSLVIFCLLFSSIDYVPVTGEIIWYLSFTAWLISLSIMLSSSIHAVAKGISSFFLSAA